MLGSTPAQANLGNVLLDMGLVTMDRLKAAVLTQMDQRGEQRLGAVLLAMSVISPEELEVALKVQDAIRKNDLVEAHLLVLQFQNRRMGDSLHRQEALLDKMGG